MKYNRYSRLAAILTAILLLIITFLVPIAAKANDPVQGDVDGDGLVTVSDVVALRALIMAANEISEDELYAADLNGDGLVTVSDVVALRDVIIRGTADTPSENDSGASSGNTASDTSSDGTSSESSGSSESGGSYDLTFKNRDLDASYDESDATVITLTGDSASVSGSGASVSGTDVTISAKGTYIVSGTLNDGRIIVAADDSVKIQVVLSGAEITCSDNAPFYVQSGDKVYLTLAPDTVNSLTDGAAYSLGADESGTDAALYSKSDLTINGSGSLNITANYKHAVVSKDDLCITGGKITVNAAGGGLYGKDCVKIAGGTLNLTVGSDGIQSDNSEDAARGYVYIADGDITINAASDGIQAQTLLELTGGILNITAGGGSGKTVGSDVSAKALKSAGDIMVTDGTLELSAAEDAVQAGGTVNISGGTFTINAASDGIQAETLLELTGGNLNITAGGGSSNTVSSDVSAKGLKCTGDLTISGGVYTINSADDAVHSNSNITISGGQITASSGDDGVHADTSLTVNDGIVTITKSYEGMESSVMTVNGGTIAVVSSDDGFNAAGGNDGSSTGGRPGQNNFTSSGGSISITGGTIQINATGDGIDSNGSLSVSGGYTYVSGPTASDNGALDYDGTASLTGGVLIAAGSTGMAQNFSTASGQCSWMYNFSSTVSGGTALTLTDSSGNELASFTPAKNYQSVVITTPDMQVGGSYTLTAGTQTATVTLSSTIVSSGGSGSSGGGQGGGPGGH